MILECVTASRIQLLRFGHKPSSSLRLNMRYYPSVPRGIIVLDQLFLSRAFPYSHFSTCYFFSSHLSTVYLAGHLGLARCSIGPIMLSGRRDYMPLPWSTFFQVWYELRNGRGHPSCILHASFLDWSRTTNPAISGSSGNYIGQKNLRPRFGIIMMYFGLSHVVRDDFCCLLSCCCLSIFEMIIPEGFLNWTWISY